MDEQAQIQAIFNPHYVERASEVRDKNIRFVHYTCAEAARSIFESKKVWLRRANCMNDYMEMHYGLEAIQRTFKNSRFRLALDEIYPGCIEEIAGEYDKVAARVPTDIYLACMSEHRASEDLLGRLSMWRAYGQGTGVAIVLKNTPFLSVSHVLKAYSSPVAYYTDAQLTNAFETAGEKIRENEAFIRGIGRDATKSAAFVALYMSALCLKHPGFVEEHEWRVFYDPVYQSSEHMEKGLETIGGVPQTVYKLPLKNIPEEGLSGIELPELVDRVIIGPTKFPVAMWDAFVQILEEAKVPDAEKKVFYSDIPLRT